MGNISLYFNFLVRMRNEYVWLNGTWGGVGSVSGASTQ